MKILFLADIHLEAGRDLGNGEFGEGSRFDDQVKVLDRIADVAIEENVTVVAVVGDVFHKPTPLPQSIIAFQKFRDRMLDAGMKMIVIAGNHDVKSAALPTALEIVDDVTLAQSPRLIPVDDVVFACLPWTPMSVLVAQEGRSADLRETATELLVRSMQHLALQAASNFPEQIPILLAHWSVSGSSLPNGLPVDQLSEVVLPWIDIDTLGWKVVALGHIHKPQVFPDGFDAKTPIFYCGSACAKDLGEIHYPHGVWIYDTEDDLLRFEAIEDRPFISYDYSVEEAMSIVGADGMPEFPFQDAVVRIRWRQGDDPTRMDEAAVRKAAHELGAHKVFIKEIDKPTASRARLTETIADDVTPADALSLWVAQTDVAGQRNGDGERFLGALRERHLDYVERLGAK